MHRNVFMLALLAMVSIGCKGSRVNAVLDEARTALEADGACRQIEFVTTPSESDIFVPKPPDTWGGLVLADQCGHPVEVAVICTDTGMFSRECTAKLMPVSQPR